MNLKRYGRCTRSWFELGEEDLVNVRPEREVEEIQYCVAEWREGDAAMN